MAGLVFIRASISDGSMRKQYHLDSAKTDIAGMQLSAAGLSFRYRTTDA